MKNILTKASYMAFGSLLTLIGYHFGNIGNNSADAQLIAKEKAPIVDEIRCRSLVIVGDDNTPHITLDTDLFDCGQINIYNEDGTRRIYLGVTSDIDSGVLTIQGKESGSASVALGVDSSGGYMALWNKVLNKPVLNAGITNKGEGYIFTRDKAGYQTWGGGSWGNHRIQEKSRK